MPKFSRRTQRTSRFRILPCKTAAYHILAEIEESVFPHNPRILRLLCQYVGFAKLIKHSTPRKALYPNRISACANRYDLQTPKLKGLTTHYSVFLAKCATLNEPCKQIPEAKTRLNEITHEKPQRFPRGLDKRRQSRSGIIFGNPPKQQTLRMPPDIHQPKPLGSTPKNQDSFRIDALEREVNSLKKELRETLTKFGNILGATPDAAGYDGLISTNEAMRRMGYISAKGFLAAAQTAKIPYIRINARTFRWAPREIELWRYKRLIAPRSKNRENSNGASPKQYPLTPQE